MILLIKTVFFKQYSSIFQLLFLFDLPLEICNTIFKIEEKTEKAMVCEFVNRYTRTKTSSITLVIAKKSV